MKWKPIQEDIIIKKINDSWERMSIEQRKLWDVIKTDPIKWQLNPWGKYGKGFWVVGIVGRSVIWFNDIEDGFNRSKFSKFGVINEYWCNQDDLEGVIQYFLNEIKDGYSSEGKAFPPFLSNKRREV